MLDIFVREPLAARTLRQSHAFAEGAVIGFAVGRIKRTDRISTFNAYWHRRAESEQVTWKRNCSMEWLLC